MRKCELARAEVTKATSAPPRVMKPFVVRPARSGSSLAASNHTKPASSSRRAAVATTWCDVGEASRNCRRSSIFASVLPVFACAVRRGARALGALVVERDRDRDVTPQETTGHLAAVALLNAGLDLGDAGRQRVALGEANQMTPANTATSSNLLTTDDTNFSTKSTPSTPTTIATSDASRAFCASNDERSMRQKSASARFIDCAYERPVSIFVARRVDVSQRAARDGAAGARPRDRAPTAPGRGTTRRVAPCRLRRCRRRPSDFAARVGALGRASTPGIEAYMAFRVGYHRGLDQLRANGWRGSGFVRCSTSRTAASSNVSKVLR